jgi:hypothetical protein
MRKHLSAVFILVVAAMGSAPARPQTTDTDLVMYAHWDDGSAVTGTAILAVVNSSGHATVLASTTLWNGWAAVDADLAANSFYDVTLVDTAGKQLLKFPVVTAMINPQNLHRGEVDLVFRKGNNSVKSAQIKVWMNF